MMWKSIVIKRATIFDHNSDLSRLMCANTRSGDTVLASLTHFRYASRSWRWSHRVTPRIHSPVATWLLRICCVTLYDLDDEEEATLLCGVYRRIISIGYRLGDIQGVACFTSSDGDALFPGNSIGSGCRLTNGPTFSVAGSLFCRGAARQREEERNSLVGRIRVRVCRLRRHRTDSPIFCRMKPGIEWHNSE